jgi:hypothetical protein
MEKTMPKASIACKCNMAYARKMRGAKRLLRIIKGLGYRASGAEA